MKSIRLIRVILLILLAPALAYAQAEFVIGSHSGWSIDGNVAMNNYLTGVEVCGGWVESGAIDLGLSLGVGSGGSTNYIGMGAFLDFFPLKQGARIPVTFGIGASFQHQFVSSANYYENASGGGGAFTAQVLRRLSISSAFAVQPSLGLEFATATRGAEDVTTAKFCGLSLMFTQESGSTMALSTRVSAANHLTTVGLSVTWVGLVQTRRYEKDDW